MSKVIFYKEGDIFEAIDVLEPNTTVILPHVCNDIGAWGAGFVVPLGNKFPAARSKYNDWSKGKLGAGSLLHGSEFKVGSVQEVVVREDDNSAVVVYNMIAQVGIGGIRPLKYSALLRCMERVLDSCKKYTNPVVHAPLFGAGLAGGDWSVISSFIEELWLPTMPVNIYYLLLPPGVNLPN